MSRSSTCYIKPQGLNYRATDILVWITAAFLRDLDFVTTAVMTHFAQAPANQSCEMLLQGTQKATRRFLFMVLHQCVGFELGDPGDFPCSENYVWLSLETFCRDSAGVCR
jgi:hypothetical protein